MNESIIVVDKESFEALSALLPEQHPSVAKAEKEEVKLAALREQLAATQDVLAELAAVVRGECPSLLDEARGGSARLDLAIDTALAAKAEQKELSG